MQNRRNYYRVLHVQPDAPAEIIRTSYRTLMQRLRMHPDLGGDHWNAALINEAFETLSDPAKRAAYDRTRQQAATPPVGPATRPAQATSRADDQAPASASTAIARAGKVASRCQFCGTVHSARETTIPGASCMSCGSPLYPAVKLSQGDRSQRAIERFPRHMPISFCLTWPATRQFTGTTQDVSISGMRFSTDLELIPNETIRIDCEFCSAIGVVRSSHQQARHPRLAWQIGVEFLTLTIKQTRGSFVSGDC
jgi:curved DNA-binding protein CbpA